MSGRSLAVSGATGFIGRHVCEHFRNLGWEVRGLVRDPAQASIEGVECFDCNLPNHIDPEGIQGADVLVHCAYATRARSRTEAVQVNEEGTRRLLGMAREAAVRRFVFMSSLSSRADAKSYYGRSKYALEHELDPRVDLIVRPGLVLSNRGEGLFQRLRDTVARVPVIPVFAGGRQVVQTVHIDDLCVGLARAIERDITGCLHIAETEGLTYAELLREVAARSGRHCRLLPVPMAPAYWILRAIETVGLPAPVTSENLLGLRALQFVATAADLERLGLDVRSAAQSLDTLIGPT